jgi:DNA/RNA-binding domain of Phe-tRNA-synthetase-like protein
MSVQDMKEIFYTITEDVFSPFPEYVRGVVVARDVRNGPAPAELTALLREAEESLRERLGTGDVAAYPRIASWREAFRKTGVKPAEFRSSIEAMARRVVKGQEIPSINALVDIGNVLSLRRLVPVGGHALDEVKNDLVLRAATGQETFVPFGSTGTEHPLPGEIVFAEGDVVLTRRWSWRQGNHTLTLPESRSVEFNVDGLPPVSAGEVESICGEVIELVTRFCGGTFETGLLCAASPRMRLL